MEAAAVPDATVPSQQLLDQLGVVRSSNGYYEAKDEPKKGELKAHYRDMYHQNRDGAGRVLCSDVEIAFRHIHR